jgi:hypothetical protein
MCKTTISPPSKKRTTSTKKATSKGVARGAYGSKYTMENVRVDMLKWYGDNPIEFAPWWRKNSIIPRRTLFDFIKQSGLLSLRADDIPKIGVVSIVNQFIEKLNKDKTNRAIASHGAIRYLSRQEESAIVNILVTLAAMGYGVTKDDCLEVINQYINLDEDQRKIIGVTEKVFRTMKKRHPKLLKIVAACSLDPARARKATRETRDAVFAKMDAYIRNLHATKKLPWKSFKDIPAANIYNMDEVGTDSTKRRSKVIASKNIGRLFQITPEGDGRMKEHITACVTTRADGKSFWLIVGGGPLFWGPWLLCCIC